MRTRPPAPKFAFYYTPCNAAMFSESLSHLHRLLIPVLATRLRSLKAALLLLACQSLLSPRSPHDQWRPAAVQNSILCALAVIYLVLYLTDPIDSFHPHRRYSTRFLPPMPLQALPAHRANIYILPDVP